MFVNTMSTLLRSSLTTSPTIAWPTSLIYTLSLGENFRVAPLHSNRIPSWGWGWSTSRMDTIVGSSWASAGTASEILCAGKYSPGYSQLLSSYAVAFPPSWREGSCIEQRRVGILGSDSAPLAVGLRQRKNIHNKRRRKFKGIMRLWVELRSQPVKNFTYLYTRQRLINQILSGPSPKKKRVCLTSCQRWPGSFFTLCKLTSIGAVIFQLKKNDRSAIIVSLNFSTRSPWLSSIKRIHWGRYHTK